MVQHIQTHFCCANCGACRFQGGDRTTCHHSVSSLVCAYILLRLTIVSQPSCATRVPHDPMAVRLGKNSAYCPISFNSNKGVTCDHLFEFLVSNTSQKEGDRVQPDTCPPLNWTLNCLTWHERPPALSNKGHVTPDKCDISNKSSKPVTRDV